MHCFLLPLAERLAEGVVPDVLLNDLKDAKNMPYFQKHCMHTCIRKGGTLYIPPGWSAILLNTDVSGVDMGTTVAHVVVVPVASNKLCTSMPKNLVDSVKKWNDKYLSRDEQWGPQQEALGRFVDQLKAK